MLCEAILQRVREGLECIASINTLLRSLVLGGHIQHPICIDIEGDLHLRHTTWGWRDAIELKLAQQVVILRELALTFEHLDQYPWLIVGECCECLRLLAWHCGVTLNERGHDATSSLQAERERCHIHEQDVLLHGSSTQHLSLHRCSIRHGFVRVD